ncbi:NAD(+) diphosphatase [Novosphingobium colocasiae]|uniref:NAD(+) diphosphatase n=1 Tax=Novosphingobium colocasiae TaxID=1256513 RepID=A0A918PEW5_9SPHN|nr:NAD(+) diphosphatase [Novosphingobium colocasiae]GGZ03690.1 NADH pyrophosphatase [Novosphingobium colocasiae]
MTNSLIQSPPPPGRAVAFAGGVLDRADHLRMDDVALRARMTASARLLRLDGLDPVLTADGGLEWASLGEAAADSELVFLGLDGERACFAEVPARNRDGASIPGPRLWQSMAQLSAGDLATFGTARALVSWHMRHRFCSVCGSPSHVAKGGWQRTCNDSACASEHFPRVDPVTIMTVEHEGRLLLGRQPRFPPRRYSALAGFVEPGETIEEAVAREVFEEAGLRVRDVQYVVSQPWPFPSSLMIGCHAVAESGDITIDVTELEDARWFTRAEVAEAMAAGDRGEEGESFIAPPVTAVANLLLRWWLERA